MAKTNDAFGEILSVIDVEQLLVIARMLREVQQSKHGEVILVVKNGNLVFVDKRQSLDVRKRHRNRY